MENESRGLSGRLIAAGAPDDLLARTGASDMEDAFLRLIENTPNEPTEVSR